MELRNLGRSGLQVSVVGLGCNNFGERMDLDQTRKVVHRAMDLGITLFDTSDSYGKRGGSESYLGEVLGARRKDIILATKFSSPMDDAGILKGTSRRYIMYAVEASLKRLKTDYIDLYQLHWPEATTPMEETLRALDDLVRSGKVRYIGSSNLNAWQVADAAWISRHYGLNSFISCQNEYSLVMRDIEAELAPACLEYNLGFLPYFPLASGLLTGKYKRGMTLPEGARLTKVKRLADRFMKEENWPIVEGLAGFCEQRGHTMLELAFSWLAGQKFVSSVIAGATQPEQVEQNVTAAGWMLTKEDRAEVDKITGAG